MNPSARVVRSSDRVSRTTLHEAPLASLHGSAVSRRYHAWRGASGRRYVVSVFPVDASAADHGLPAFDGFVLLAVARDGRGLFARDVLAIETECDRSAAIGSALAHGVTEWHIHLLAEECGRRRAVAADLLAGHGRPAMAILSAQASPSAWDGPGPHATRRASEPSTSSVMPRSSMCA